MAKKAKTKKITAKQEKLLKIVGDLDEKVFEGTITVKNGDKENDSHYIVYAENYEEAMEKIKAAAEEFYTESYYDDDGNLWDGFGECIIEWLCCQCIGRYLGIKRHRNILSRKH